MLKILGGLCDVQAPVDILRVIKNCIVFMTTCYFSLNLGKAGKKIRGENSIYSRFVLRRGWEAHFVAHPKMFTSL